MADSLCTWRIGVLAAVMSAVLELTACGGNSGASNSPPTFQQPVSQASASSAFVMSASPGITPFISSVAIVGAPIEGLAEVEFTIAPKPGSVSRPVHVQYSAAALSRQRYVFAGGGGSVLTDAGFIRLPIFGLYAGFQNQVLVQLDFQDGSTKSLPVVIPTAPYIDPNGIYDRPIRVVPRVAGSALDFDFFIMKSTIGPLVIIDTDGEIRWVGAGVNTGLSAALAGDGFVIGDASFPTLYRLGLDGSLVSSVLPSPPYTMFHHNIDYGKQGLFAEIDDNDNGVVNIQSTLVELDPDGNVENQWELGDVLSTYMRSQGDDPSAFVRPGVDWFHMNASTYDPRDNSIIVSSRENFLMKVDYATGNIIWILGDPSKYWYTFPSLRAKALTLQPGDLYPIGQHAVSITTNGLIMVFNDGFQSVNQPPGAPAGASRTYSAVSAYSVDPASGSAHESWRFDYGQSIYSFVCGSAYESSGGSVLVDFATADQGANARLVGLDGDHNVVFDFKYASPGLCGAAWNAEAIALDNFTVR
jgi:arylsulfate sulfotransferase